MYRSRLKGSLDRNVLDYLSSMDEDKALLMYDITGSIAHVIMLFRCKIISEYDAKVILLALRDAMKDEIKYDEYEDIHEALEAYVIAHAKLEHGGKMHTARSRNDQVALDLRLLIRDEINIISNKLVELIDTLLVKASNTLDCIMPMYTHLQQAQIGLLSHYLLAYADILFRDLERLDDCYDRVNRSPLGASAIGGTSLPIDRGITAELLAFESLIDNSIDATSSRDFMLEFSFILTDIMLNLSRIAEDLIIWSSSEFGYIELPDELTSTSSVMPQKKNPCPLELLRARTASVIGDTLAIMTIIKSLPTGYNRDLQDTKRILFGAIRRSKESIDIMRMVIDGLIPKRDRMRESARKGYAIALDLAEVLVRDGISFREAHKIVGSLVRLADSKRKSLDELSEDEVNDKRIYSILRVLNIEDAIEKRISRGAASKREDERILDERKGLLKIFRERVDARKSLIEGAMNRLEEMMNRIING